MLVLRQQFGAGRIRVFGSLADRERYTRRYDIDLAVWDISPERFYDALEAVNEISRDIKVDLVNPQRCKSQALKSDTVDGLHNKNCGATRKISSLLYILNGVEEQESMKKLMTQYRDVLMGLGDASLVVTAKVLNQQEIFTLDKDFFVYRTKEGQAFNVIP